MKQKKKVTLKSGRVLDGYPYLVFALGKTSKECRRGAAFVCRDDKGGKIPRIPGI